MKNCLSAIAFLFFGITAFGEPISFARLPAGEVIGIDYTSQGCFHSENYEIEIQRGAVVSAKVTRLEHRWDETGKRLLEPHRVVIGTITLSDEDLAGLDRLLKFYRTHPPGGCTTVEYAELKQKNGETVKATEALMDDTCRASEQKGVIMFSEIIHRAEIASLEKHPAKSVKIAEERGSVLKLLADIEGEKRLFWIQLSPTAPNHGDILASPPWYSSPTALSPKSPLARSIHEALHNLRR